MISKILLALDASDRSARVASVGGVLAAKFGATVYPFRAIVIPTEFPAAGAGSKPDLLPETMMSDNLAELMALVSPIVDANVAPPIIRVGEASHAILVASDELQIDLIVMGSHGYRGWDRLLGTTVGSVANRAGCSVFIVRETPGAAHSTRPPSRPSSRP